MKSLVQTYPQLLKQVRESFVLAQKRIEEERVKTYWKTGKLIQTHIRIHQGRAQYGKRTLARLAKDLEVDHSVLARMVRFHSQFPKLATRPKLTWSHYRLLLPLKNQVAREKLVQKTFKKGWNHNQLAEAIQKLTSKIKPKTTIIRKKNKSILKRPVLGPPYHYRIIEQSYDDKTKANFYVDLGFGAHLLAEPFNLRNLQVMQIVHSVKDKSGDYQVKRTQTVTVRQLFCYNTKVIRVIDGDTIWMHIDLGFGIFKKIKIRLKGIDTPDISTKSGKKAKRYLENLLRDAQTIQVRSTTAGKFDRYLGDLFINSELYVNQHLLTQGLAERL